VFSAEEAEEEDDEDEDEGEDEDKACVRALFTNLMCVFAMAASITRAGSSLAFAREALCVFEFLAIGGEIKSERVVELCALAL
jgi:hypothetical protein